MCVELPGPCIFFFFLVRIRLFSRTSAVTSGFSIIRFILPFALPFALPFDSSLQKKHKTKTKIEL